MFCPKSKAQVFKRPTCTVFEYKGTKNLGFAVAEIKEKYPEHGSAKNTKVDMTYFVEEGAGKFFLEDEVFEIKKGDLIIIEKGKWYRVEGSITSIMASNPAWFPEQYEAKK